jgi:hypothetical protein
VRFCICKLLERTGYESAKPHILCGFAEWEGD